MFNFLKFQAVFGSYMLQYEVNVLDVVDAMQGRQRSDYELEKLHSLATSVGSRVGQLTCQKAVDR